MRHCLLALLLAACSSGKTGTDDTAGSGADSGTPTTDGGGDGGADGGSDGGADGGSPDGGADGGSPDGGSPDGGADGGSTDGVPVDAPSARVDDTIGSLVTVSWDQQAAATAWVEYKLDGEDWRSSPPVDLSVGATEQLLLGIPYGEEVTWRVANDLGDGPLYTDSQVISTDPLPDGVPEAILVASDETRQSPDSAFVFIGLNGTQRGSDGAWTVIIDRLGRTVWAWPTISYRITLHPRLSFDGTELLIDYNSFWAIYDQGAQSQIARLHVDGSVVEVIDVPGMHHPFTEMSDGSILFGRYGNYTDETLVQRHPDGTETELFSCQQFRQDNGIGDYCGSNTIWWNPDTDHVLYSFYSIETIVEIDRSSTDVVRWFGHANGAWDFDDPAHAFYWQHGGYITDDGTLLTSARRGDTVDETVWREYEIDDSTETLTQVASLGEDEGVYGDVMGEAHRLDNGNTLHNTGSAPRLREFTPDGDVVWDVEWDADFIGRSTPIEDLYTLAH